MKLGRVFALKKVSDVLSKASAMATALAVAGGRLTPLSALGLAAHATAFLFGAVSRDLREVAATWHVVDLDRHLHALVRRTLVPHFDHAADDWQHARVGEQGVLVHMPPDWCAGEFFAERDPAAVLRYVRDETWRRVGRQASVVPSGKWQESVDVRPSSPRTQHDTARGTAIWQRIRPWVAAGLPRSVLLDGPPRTGKSTIAEQLVRLAEVELGQPLRTLRVSVSDFGYLSPTVLEAVVDLLRPDAVLIDDVDRLGSGDRLLDFFERVRLSARLVVVTANEPGKMTAALRLPGRIDEVELVVGVGPELATVVLGDTATAIPAELRATVESWPVGLVAELAQRVRHREGFDAAAEVAGLAARWAEVATPPKPDAAAPAATTGATGASARGSAPATTGVG